MSELADHVVAEIHESIAVRAELGPQAARVIRARLRVVQGLVAFGNGGAPRMRSTLR